MNAEKTSMKYGFIYDANNLKLKKVLKDNTKLKQVYIDIYPENPLGSSTLFMLLLRVDEKSVIVSNDGDRFILKKNDTYQTHFMNVLFSKVTECFFRVSESCSEFIINIQNIYYRITVFN